MWTVKVVQEPYARICTSQQTANIVELPSVLFVSVGLVPGLCFATCLKCLQMFSCWLSLLKISKKIQVHCNNITLPKTNSSHLKMDGWKTSFLFEWLPGWCYVGFRECNGYIMCQSISSDELSLGTTLKGGNFPIHLIQCFLRIWQREPIKNMSSRRRGCRCGALDIRTAGCFFWRFLSVKMYGDVFSVVLSEGVHFWKLLVQYEHGVVDFVI